MPAWLHWLAGLWLAMALLAALAVVADIVRGRRQKMAVMEWVWPLTVLYAGPVGLWAYYRVGRQTTAANIDAAMARGEGYPASRRPFWQSAALGTSHCGAGCTLGDLVAEGAAALFPGIAFPLLGHALFSVWVYDYVLAFAFGIAFQYLTIKPMRGLSPGAGLRAALKADALSLTSWQVGMYGWMAIVTFGLVGTELAKTGALFWFMMQIAMVAGFVTSYPVNWWLLRRGIKERM